MPIAVGDFLIIRAVNESGGFAVALPDDEILAARDKVAADDGLLLCPEGAATVAAYSRALAEGKVGPDETAMLYNCAHGLEVSDGAGRALARQGSRHRLRAVRRHLTTRERVFCLHKSLLWLANPLKTWRLIEIKTPEGHVR